MSIINILLTKLLRFRSFRIFLVNVYPVLKKFKIIFLFQKLNNGSFSDPWDHFEINKKGILKTHDLENFSATEALVKYTIDAENLIVLDRSYNFGILSGSVFDLNDIEQACKALNVKYTVYDIKDPALFEKITNSDCDGIFISPSFANVIDRNVFHELTQILSSETSLKIYPTVRELNIYESKRTLAAFLSVNKIPHPSTSVFYDFEKAKVFLDTCRYPVVFKTHIGASSSGVEILRNKKQAVKMAEQLFFKYYLRKMETEKRSIEWGYMLLQEYIDDVKEYRVIKAGDSWFGYQKWKEQHQIFLSGSGKQKMINPSFGLLDFCYGVAEKFHFTTMCFDIFENKKGEFLVNELQTWFGSYDPTEMYVNNIPGRYRMIEGEWTFEPGFYNVYGTNLLRIAHFISLLQDCSSKQFSKL